MIGYSLAMMLKKPLNFLSVQRKIFLGSCVSQLFQLTVMAYD